MKRTLLAIGFAVLMSLMAIPRGERYCDLHYSATLERFMSCREHVKALLPFFLEADDMGLPHWSILPRTFLLETVFTTVLAVVIVNLLPRRPRKDRERD